MRSNQLGTLAIALLVLLTGVVIAEHVAIADRDVELLKKVSSCEVDLDGNGENDLAFFVQTKSEIALFIVLRNQGELVAFRPFSSSIERGGLLELSCRFGSTLKETEAGPTKGPRAVYKTPGAYVELFQPESSSVAFFYDGTDFKKVWTSD